jgi:hypothetical protein
LELHQAALGLLAVVELELELTLASQQVFDTKC